jgi:hemerythrin-like domain-containing protein
VAVRIGEEPENFFTNPLGLLNDCHRRIENFLDVLIKVTTQAHNGALNDEQRSALEVSLRYFKEAAPKHTEDEEESLFPRMRRVANPQVKAVLTELDALERDHKMVKGWHKEVERLGREWLHEGRLPVQRIGRMAKVLEVLSTVYRRHIEFEEARVFPLAAESLDPSEIEAIGQEMAARRNIDPKTAQRD